jgi:hypothetical protein
MSLRSAATHGGWCLTPPQLLVATRELSLTEAALLPVLQDAIDLLFRQLDGQRPTYGSYTGFVFAVVKPDFPSPSTAIGQLHDGVFYSLVFHKIGSTTERNRTYGKMTAQYVHLCT